MFCNGRVDVEHITSLIVGCVVFRIQIKTGESGEFGPIFLVIQLNEASGSNAQ